MALRRPAAAVLFAFLAAACGQAFESGGSSTTGAGGAGTTTPGQGGATSTGAGGDATGGGSTGTSAGGGSTGTNVGGGATTTSSTGTGPEVCTNGADDDGDGRVDCDDPECDVMDCTPLLPEGWEGPVWLASGQSAPPACPPGSSALTELHVGPATAQPAICECTCELGVGTCVALAALHAYPAGGCDGIETTFQNLGFGACVPLDVANTNALKLELRGVDQAPTCEVSATSDAPAVQWGGEAVLCGPDAVGVGCVGGGACQRPPPPDFATCVRKSGDVDCPVGEFTQRTVLFGDVDDTRGCAECSCGEPTEVGCPTHIELHSELGCFGNSSTVPPGDGCADLPGGNKSLKVVADSPVPTGSCGDPVAPKPVGTVVGTGAVTVCCVP